MFGVISRALLRIGLIRGGGGYDKVYVRLHSPSRDAQYIKLIWESNPYVDGVVEIQDTTSDTTESSPIDSQKQNLESSFSESKQLTESTTPKNPSEALPDSNNSACGSTSRAESKDSKSLDSAIFAEQKSNKICSASAHTDTRPCRGGENQEKGGSSAAADFSKETSFCLDKEKRGSPLDCRAKGLQAKRSKNSGGFFGALASGEGITPLFAKKQSDFENLGSIRENTTLRNLESTESSADSESKTFTESSAEILKDAQLTESSHIDSEASAESKADSQSSRAFTESSPTDSKTITQSPQPSKSTNPFSHLECFSYTCNLLDSHMLELGLDDGRRLHEPELYYTPKFREEYHKVIFDPNWISNAGKIQTPDIMHFFDANNIQLDAVLAKRGDKCLFDYRADVEVIETKSLEDFCDLLYSARAIYCLVTGTATLAAALKKSATIIVGENISPYFLHSPLHTYIYLRHDKNLHKVLQLTKRLQIRLKVKTINRLSHLLPTKKMRLAFRDLFACENLHRIKRFVPSGVCRNL